MEFALGAALGLIVGVLAADLLFDRERSEEDR